MPEQSKEQPREKVRHEYLTTQQLAEILQTSRGTIDRLRRSGKIPYIRVSERVIRFNLRDVRHSLAVSAQQDSAPEEQAEDHSNQLSFEEFFESAAVPHS